MSKSELFWNLFPIIFFGLLLLVAIDERAHPNKYIFLEKEDPFYDTYLIKEGHSFFDTRIVQVQELKGLPINKLPIQYEGQVIKLLGQDSYYDPSKVYKLSVLTDWQKKARTFTKTIFYITYVYFIIAFLYFRKRIVANFKLLLVELNKYYKPDDSDKVENR